jgi:hypothetical protein
MRIDCGPGYRVYFAKQGTTIFCCLPAATNLRRKKGAARPAKSAKSLTGSTPSDITKKAKAASKKNSSGQILVLT